MINGGVGPRLDPRIPLTFLDSAGSPLIIDATIDTGFAGFLAMSRSLIAHLTLSYMGDYPLELADGTEVLCPCYEARVEWFGKVRTVRAYELGPDLLVGINFLWGKRLKIDVIVGGIVTVEPIP